MNSKFTRILSVLLVLVMVFSPGVPVFAAEDIDYSEAVDALIVFSDLHTDKDLYKEDLVSSTMSRIAQITGLSFSTVNSAGDAFSYNEDPNTHIGSTDPITGAVRNGLGDPSVTVNYLWSDHDRSVASISKDSGFIYGFGEDENYYIYALSMADMSTFDRYYAGFTDFDDVRNIVIPRFLSEASTLDKSKPLFILSHQPLFDRRNDNGHALAWCEAINQVAQEMDVAYFFGHNHKYDALEDYYCEKGSYMDVAYTNPANITYDSSGRMQYNNHIEPYDESVCLSERVRLNFSHMCAGYFDPLTKNEGTRLNTVLTVSIFQDEIVYETYDANARYDGAFALQSRIPRDHKLTQPELIVSGKNSYFVNESLELTVSLRTGRGTEDVTALASITGYDLSTPGHQTVEISYGDLTTSFNIFVGRKTFSNDQRSVTVTVDVPGATALSASPLSNDCSAALAVAGRLTDSFGYEIRLFDFDPEATATVEIMGAGSLSDPAVLLVDDNGVVHKIDAELSDTGSIVFTTNSFGCFFVGSQTISEPLEGTVTTGAVVYEPRTVYIPARSTFEDGRRYILAGEDAIENGNLLAYLNNGGNEGAGYLTLCTEPLITDNGTITDGYIESADSTMLWTAVKNPNGEGYFLTNNGGYIGGSTGNTIMTSRNQAADAAYTPADKRLHTAPESNRKYLYYSTYGSEMWKWDSSKTSSTSSRAMTVYEEVTVNAAVSSQAVYSVQAEEVQHCMSTSSAKIDFALLENGVPTDLPEGSTVTFEKIYDHHDAIDTITDDGTIWFNYRGNSWCICYVKVSVTWDGGTAYKYVRVVSEPYPNPGKDYSIASVVDATCTTVGFTTYSCDCGDEHVAEILPIVSHSYVIVESVESTPISEGYTTYACYCGDSYIDNRTEALEGSVVTGGDTFIEKTIYVPAQSIENKGRYLVVGEKGAGSGKLIAYVNNGGSEALEDVTLSSDPTVYDGEYIEISNPGAMWTANGSSAAGYVLANNGGYIGGEYGNTVMSNFGDANRVVYDAEADRLRTLDSQPMYIYYSTYGTENWKWGASSANSSTSSRNILLFKEATVQIPTYVTPVTYTLQTDEQLKLAHGATAQLSYALLADGVETAAPADGRYSFDIINDTDGVIAGISEDGTVTAGGVSGSVSVRVSFTWSEGTVYKYATVTVSSDYCEHKYFTEVFAPTCTEVGYSINTCTVCGYSNFSNLTAATGHSYDAVVTRPTYTSGGYTTYTCHCGDSYVGDETAPLEKGETVLVEKTVFVPAETLEDGGRYLIVGEDSGINGNLIAHLNNGGYEGFEKVTVLSDDAVSADGYIEINNPNAVWTAQGDAGSGYILTSNGGYIGGEYGNTVMGYSHDARRVVYDAAADRLHSAGSNPMYLYYSTYGDENWKWTYNSANSSTSSRQILLYKEVTLTVEMPVG